MRRDIGPVASCESCGAGPLVSKRRRGDVPGSIVHYGRGLCGRCYTRHHRTQTLGQFVRFTRSTADLAASADRAKARCPDMTWREIAEGLGVTRDALERARIRTRRAQVMGARR